ncbi:MAG: hypothetical protein NTW86_30000 [Candidatus Sumerlaeota bacterium]|nr:hypothetical protein [Candidatus Sumerlaeota bacterium]
MPDPFSEILLPEIPLVDIHVHLQGPGLVGPIVEGMAGGGCVRLGLLGISYYAAMHADTLLRFTKAHPFAHFRFLSKDLPRARAVFQEYPHVYFDTTPGAQMLINFPPKIDEARDFFIEWQDRIVFGKDLNDQSSSKGRESDAGRTHRAARAYYGTDQMMPREFPGGDRLPGGQYFRGMSLPKTALRKLFEESVEQIMGKKPAALPV